MFPDRLPIALLLALIALLAAFAVSSCTAPRDDTPNHAPVNATSPPVMSPLPTSPIASPDLGFTSVSPLPAPTAEIASPVEIQHYTYKIVNVYPHDPTAFTEGLLFEDGWLYESTGLRGHSTFRRVELESGNVMQMHQLPVQLFGEGVTIFGDEIIQLTWKSHVGFVYEKEGFKLLRVFHYPTEGWGLTQDGERLIMSDGTDTLHFLDPETLQKIGQLQVYDHNGPVTLLNELEFVQGDVFANVWQTDRIARIDLDTGQVTGWINLEGLLDRADLETTVDVLNGIAYDAENERLFVTGKWWPKLFEIQIVEVDPAQP